MSRNEVTFVGGGTYWEGRPVARALFVPSGQVLLLSFSASKLIFLPFRIELVYIIMHAASER